jgi:hypothetical protein
MSDYANGWHAEERVYGPDGTLAACLVNGKVMDIREVAPTEQDLIIQRLNERLRESGTGK